MGVRPLAPAHGGLIGAFAQVFTVYCSVCSGPAMDITDWARDRQKEKGEGQLRGWEVRSGGCLLRLTG